MVYRGIQAVLPGPRGRLTALAFAGWISTVLAAASCAGQLAWSDKVEWRAAFTAMVGVHLLIGLGEGVISALIFAAIQRTRPELMQSTEPTCTGHRWREFVRYGLMVSVGMALFVAPFACPWPDGLEAVAEKLGFAQAATKPTLPALAPDYAFPGIHSATLATALAGAIGAIFVFLLALLLARVLIPNRSAPVSAANSRP